MANNGISILDLVISKLNRLAGIVPEGSADPEKSAQSAELAQRPSMERLLNNDIYSIIDRQSGSFKKKRSKPCLITDIDQRRMKASMTAADRTNIGCQLLPETCNLDNRLAFETKTFCGTFEKEGDLFVLAVQDHTLRLFDTRPKKWTEKIRIQGTDVGWSILDTTMSSDGKFIAYSSWSDALCLTTMEGEQTPLLLHPTDNRFCIFSLRFASDNQEIVAVGSDCRLYIYNLEQQRYTSKTLIHDEEVNAVCFGDAHSRILYTGGDDGLIKVWDRRTLNERDPKPVGVFSGHRHGVTYIDSKGDERFLISNSKDQTIKLWDIRHFASDDGIAESQRASRSHCWDYRWQPIPMMNQPTELAGDCSIMTYKGHRVLQTLIRCRFSPMHTTGQRFIYTGSADGRVYIYDLLTGKVEKCLGLHKAVVRDVSWHPYLPILRSSSFDGISHEWIPNLTGGPETTPIDRFGKHLWRTQQM